MGLQTVVTYLRTRDMRAYEEMGPSPTLVDIFLAEGGVVRLARGFNIDGWEAVYEATGKDPIGLEDGPLADAPDEDVVAWAVQITRNLV